MDGSLFRAISNTAAQAYSTPSSTTKEHTLLQYEKVLTVLRNAQVGKTLVSRQQREDIHL